MTVFNPPIVLKSKLTNAIWSLGILDNQLALIDGCGNARVLVNAENYVIIERTPVTGWLTGILLDAWIQFAHEEPGGCLNSGGLSVLEDIHDVLMSAGLIDADGQPHREMTPPAGAGGMVEEERE